MSGIKEQGDFWTLTHQVTQEWKSDELMEVRTRRAVCEQPPGLFTQHTDTFNVDHDMASDTVVESDM